MARRAQARGGPARLEGQSKGGPARLPRPASERQPPPTYKTKSGGAHQLLSGGLWASAEGSRLWSDQKSRTDQKWL